MRFFLLFVLACGEKTADTSSVENQVSASDTGSAETEEEAGESCLTAGQCTPLDEEECIASDACTSIMASPLTYNEADTCWTREEESFTQCMSIDTNCGEAEIYARPDPDASCMLFRNTCIPVEWDICDARNFSECTE